jgi:hypothetical protein
MDGSLWIPYQPTGFPTRSFPDYVSSHCTYSAAAAYRHEVSLTDGIVLVPSHAGGKVRFPANHGNLLASTA